MKTLLKAVLNIYLLSVAIFAIKFNYDYARSQGFLQWVFFGEVVATGRAFVWPIYFFSQDSDDRKPVAENRESTLGDFRKSVTLIQESFAYEEEHFSGFTGAIDLNGDKFRELVLLKRKALEAAKTVSADDLRKLHPDLPAMYRNKFIGGLETYLEGVRNNDNQKINRGTVMVNDFGNWYRNTL